MNHNQAYRHNERLMLLAVFFFWFSVYTYPSFLTAYVTDRLQASGTIAGMVVGVYGLTQMAFRIPLGIWSDVLKKRKPFIMLGFGFSILASVGLAVTAFLSGNDRISQGLALATLILRGISGITAATWVHFSILYAAGYPAGQVSTAMSRIIVPQCGSQILAMLIGAQLAGYIGEAYAFLLATAAGIVGLILMAHIKDQRPTGVPLTFRGLIDVARNRHLLMGTLLATLYQMVAWSTALGFVQNWAREVIGLTTAQLGYLSVANLLPNMVLASLSGTRPLQRFGRKALLIAGFVLLAAACFLYPKTSSLGSLLAVQALLGSGVGLIMPQTMSSAIEEIPENKRGAAMGIYQAVYGLGMFVGPVLAGLIMERFPAAASGGSSAVPAYSAVFSMAMAIALIGLALTFFTGGKRQD